MCKQSIRKCIDSALAVLSWPVDEMKHASVRHGAFNFDLPPIRPRRSLDLPCQKLSLRRSTSSDVTYDRFQLSASEHLSGSCRAPRRPSRPSDGVDKSPIPPDCGCRPSLDCSRGSSRDVMIHPPPRTRSHEGCGPETDLVPNQGDDSSRVIRAPRESSSQKTSEKKLSKGSDFKQQLYC